MKQLPILDLIRRLCDALDGEKIAYCHWKSNIALDSSLSGDNDLDLLISRADAQRFTSILSRLVFKEARVSIGQQAPGTLHYYGYDEATGKIVHVHVYYQLILGRDVTKGYRIPIEKLFFEYATKIRLLKVPAPEFEFIVFVVRMVLKFSITDAILGGKLSLSTAAPRELEYLKSQVSQACMYDILKRHLPSIDAKLFDDCLRSLQPDCAIWTRLGVRKRLQNRLNAHASRSQISDIFLGVFRQVTEIVLRRMFGYSPQKRITHGGTMIALIGGDGSGKSTTVNELYTWLHEIFDVVKIHMGRPPRSWSTFCVDSTMGLERRLRILLGGRQSAQSATDTINGQF